LEFSSKSNILTTNSIIKYSVILVLRFPVPWQTRRTGRRFCIRVHVFSFHGGKYYSPRIIVILMTTACTGLIICVVYYFELHIQHFPRQRVLSLFRLVNNTYIVKSHLSAIICTVTYSPLFIWHGGINDNNKDQLWFIFNRK